MICLFVGIDICIQIGISPLVMSMWVWLSQKESVKKFFLSLLHFFHYTINDDALDTVSSMATDDVIMPSHSQLLRLPEHSSIDYIGPDADIISSSVILLLMQYCWNEYPKKSPLKNSFCHFYISSTILLMTMHLIQFLLWLLMMLLCHRIRSFYVYSDADIIRCCDM